MPFWSYTAESRTRLRLTDGLVNDDILVSWILASLVYTQDIVGTTINLSVYVTVQVILKGSPAVAWTGDVVMLTLSSGKSIVNDKTIISFYLA